MDVLFNIIKDFSYIGLVISLIILVAFINSKVKKETITANYSKKVLTIINSIIIVSLAGFLITNPIVHECIGLNDIRIKPDGVYCYYVKVKGDYLPAQILIVNNEKSFDDYGPVDRGFYIQKLFFDNGKYAKFTYQPLILNESYPADDDYGNIWHITLLNQHASFPYANETTQITMYNICVNFAYLFLLVFSIIFIKKHRNDLIEQNVDSFSTENKSQALLKKALKPPPIHKVASNNAYNERK